MKRKALMIVIISSSLLIFTGIVLFIIGNHSKKSNEYEKIDTEISYLDIQIEEILDLYQNYYSESNNVINWEEIKLKISILYNSWNSIILDISRLNISSEDLTSFGKKLDSIMLNVQNRDVNQSMKDITDLYGILVNYLEVYSTNDLQKSKYQTKYYLMQSYQALGSNNWTLINDDLNKAISVFYSIISSETIIKQNTIYQINQAYISINELKNSILVKDKDLFYLKYRIAMNQLQDI